MSDTKIECSGYGAYKFMDSKEVGLRQRIFDLKDLGEIINSAMSTFESKTSLLFEALGGINANRDTLALVLAFGHSLNVFEVANSPRKKLGLC